MCLFLPVICQSHTNLLHGLTHFWRVISERIRKRKMNSHFKTQRHLSEILCRSSSTHTKLSGFFPASIQIIWITFPLFPIPRPLKSLGDRRICCYQLQDFQKTCPGQPTPNTLGARLERERWGSLWYKMELSEMILWLQKILGKWRLSHLLTNRLEIFTFSEAVQDIWTGNSTHCRGEWSI